MHTLQTSKLLYGCSGTVDAPLVHCNNQLCLSWARIYQVLSSMLNVFRSLLTLSLHLNLTLCAGEGLGNQPDRNYLGRCRLSIQATWPSHCSPLQAIITPNGALMYVKPFLHLFIADVLDILQCSNYPQYVSQAAMIKTLQSSNIFLFSRPSFSCLLSIYLKDVRISL